MTDTPNTETQKPAKKQRAPRKPRTLSSVVNAIAQKNGADATKTGKRVRAYIRAHDADLRKSFNWPPKDKTRADGNRYAEMPNACATFLTDKLSRKS